LMAYPANYRYTKEHEWVDAKDGVAKIGITDYAQHELGDVVFVELPEPGKKLETGKSFGTVESVKAVSEIYAPASGEVLDAIPEKYRLREPLKLPGPFSEAEVIDYFKQRAGENSLGYSSFLGAGVYQHLRSVITDTILLRGEFLTSYTPYQAEITQGTLQAIFEFQTLMCQLTGQEMANASMYDGATATTEAVLMAERLTGRHRVIVARSLHPEYRQVLDTY